MGTASREVARRCSLPRHWSSQMTLMLQTVCHALHGHLARLWGPACPHLVRDPGAGCLKWCADGVGKAAAQAKIEAAVLAQPLQTCSVDVRSQAQIRTVAARFDRRSKRH